MAAWQTYTITPFDTLFFRDGRPFVAGEGTDAMSLFPPTPLTLQGLIRSKLLARQRPGGDGGRDDGCGLWAQYANACASCAHDGNCDVQSVVGRVKQPADKNGTLQLRGPWLLIQGTAMVPIPLDVIAKEDDAKAITSGTTTRLPTGVLSPVQNHTPVSNLPKGLRPLAPPEAWDKFTSVPGWMAWPAFETYLQGKAPTLTLGQDWWRPEDVALSELRPGLEIEDGRYRAQEGHLYFARHIRLHTWEKEIRLAVELAGLGNQAGSLTQFQGAPCGGERRAVALEALQPDPGPWRNCPATVGSAVNTTTRVKLVLTQPAWFKQGWIPTGWDESKGEAQIHGTRCTWVGTAMDRPDRFGGWDLAKRDQKPVRAFVPRKTVYYLTVNNAADAAKVLPLWNAGFSETPDGEPFEYDQIGLGQTFIGTWNWKE